jgi:hypothetical protein
VREYATPQADRLRLRSARWTYRWCLLQHKAPAHNRPGSLIGVASMGSQGRPYEIADPAFIQRFGFRITRFGHSLYHISNFFIVADATTLRDRKVIQHEGILDLSVFKSQYDSRLYFTSLQMRKSLNQPCLRISLI